MTLVKVVYELTQNFPMEEKFGLAQQMRRAAVSIPSNIAEGAARSSAKEYAYFLNVARGSLAELDTQLQIAVMLEFATLSNDAFALSDQVGKLLTGLYKKWNTQ